MLPLTGYAERLSVRPGETLRFHVANATGDPVDIWLNRLRLTTVEIKNYKAGNIVDWEDQMYNRQSKGQDYTVASGTWILQECSAPSNRSSHSPSAT